MNYFMLVVLFPATYLVINIIASKEQGINPILVTGYFTSLIISLYINMQSTLVLNTNEVSILELYASLQITPLQVFIAQSIQHMLYVLPAFILMILILIIIGQSVAVILIIIWLILTIWFLSVLAITLGSIIKNPNLGGPVINVLYMIIIMTTPLYYNVADIESGFKIALYFNPLTHICILLNYSAGIEPPINIYVSFIILIIISSLLSIFIKKRWNNKYAVEKLNLF